MYMISIDLVQKRTWPWLDVHLLTKDIHLHLSNRDKTNKQTNKQTNNQPTNQPTNQASKQANKQTNKQ